jgi:hypothetical protein
MEIGDRVRSLHGKEEGIIRRIIDQKTVEVEIDDGFLIPFLKRDLVRIDREESESFKKEIQPASNHKEKDQNDPWKELSQILLAIETKELDINLWLINHTELVVLFAVHATTGGEYRGLSYGTLGKYNYSKIDTWSLKEQDRWPLLQIDVISFQEKGKDPGRRISRSVVIDKNKLLKKKVKAPLLNIESFLVFLSEEAKPVDPEKVKNALFSETENRVALKDISAIKKDMVVDLHIETLITDQKNLRNEDILKIQMDHFEKKLEEALIQNVRSITFIHGIGSGVLRQKIHKYLSHYPHMNYFEDAQKERFGFGATKVYLK